MDNGLSQGPFHLGVLHWVSERRAALKAATSAAAVPSKPGQQPTAQPGSVDTQATLSWTLRLHLSFTLSAPFRHLL